MTKDDDLMARLLAAAGRRDALPAELEQKWKDYFVAQMALAIRRRRMRRVLGSAVAAALATVAVIVAKHFQAPVVPQVVAIVSSSSSTNAKPGAELLAGEVIESGAGRIALRYGDNDVRIDVATRIHVDARAMTLERGSVYVDTGALGSSSTPLSIVTSRGSITHVGTQFVVQDDGESLTVAVREGRVTFLEPEGSREVVSDATSAGVLEVRGTTVQTSRAPRHGGLWQWVTHDVSAPASLDGRSAAAFLAWYARETGRTVRYVNADAEAAAAAALLHGVGGLPMADALPTVSSITRLRIEVSSTDASVLVASEFEQHTD